MSIPDSGTAESMYFRKKHFTFSEKCDIIIPAMCFPPLAQLDRVSDSDSEGHRFESCRAGQNENPFSEEGGFSFCIIHFH